MEMSKYGKSCFKKIDKMLLHSHDVVCQMYQYRIISQKCHGNTDIDLCVTQGHVTSSLPAKENIFYK